MQFMLKDTKCKKMGISRLPIGVLPFAKTFKLDKTAAIRCKSTFEMLL